MRMCALDSTRYDVCDICILRGEHNMQFVHRMTCSYQRGVDSYLTHFPVSLTYVYVCVLVCVCVCVCVYVCVAVCDKGKE